MKAASMHGLVAALAISLVSAGCSEKAPQASVATESPASVASAGTDSATAVVASATVQEYVPSASLAPGGHCSLDAINGGAIGGATARVGEDVSFGGWVSDIDNQVPTAALFVLEGSSKSYSLPLVAGVERPDVAAALSNEALKNSGFNLVAKIDAVAPGEYSLAIVLGADRASRCELNAKLTVAN